MTTANEKAAEKIGRSIDGQIFRLSEEKSTLLTAAARILEIDAELAELQIEKARIDPRRPPRTDRVLGVDTPREPPVVS